MTLRPKPLALLGALPGLILAALLMLLVLAGLHERSQVHGAQLFCSTLIPRLETYHAKHGTFPRKIDAVLDPGDQVPGRLRGKPYWYEPRSDGFTLTIFGEELVGVGVTWYDSKVGRWQTAAG